MKIRWVWMVFALAAVTAVTTACTVVSQPLAGNHIELLQQANTAYADGFVPGAVNLPLRHIVHNLDQLPQDEDTPILVYCRSMNRSTHALVVLRQLGFSEVYNLKGGILAYSEFVSENPESVLPHAKMGGAALPTAEPGTEYFGDDC